MIAHDLRISFTGYGVLIEVAVMAGDHCITVRKFYARTLGLDGVE